MTNSFHLGLKMGVGCPSLDPLVCTVFPVSLFRVEVGGERKLCTHKF